MQGTDGGSPGETTGRLKVAYLTSYYPAVSHTFIRREVVALRQLGVDVTTFAIQSEYGAGVLGPDDTAELESTRYIVGRSRFSLARELLRSVLAHPGAVAGVALSAVRSVRGSRRRLWQLFYVAEAAILQRWVAAVGATHIHAHFGNAPADVARWASELGNRIGGTWTWSFTMHGPTEFYAVEENGLGGKAEAADFVACISDFCRSQLMAFSDPSAWPRFEIVHCGIVPEEFSDANVDDDGVCTILCVGRLVPVKGQWVLLRAAQRLAEMGINARLVFVGDGPSRASLEVEAARCGVDASFTGYLGQDGVAELLTEADVFCLPSFAEGLPVVLMEAMASGLPVVTTRIAGIPELVEHGVSGFVLAPGRDDLLADALAELARDPERARAMGKAGQTKVRDQFDVRESAQILQGLFAGLDSASAPADSPAVGSGARR
jgi:glycosyltransferase involved in cell wall biosynthesis